MCRERAQCNRRCQTCALLVGCVPLVCELSPEQFYPQFRLNPSTHPATPIHPSIHPSMHYRPRSIHSSCSSAWPTGCWPHKGWPQCTPATAAVIVAV